MSDKPELGFNSGFVSIILLNLNAREENKVPRNKPPGLAYSSPRSH